MEGVPRLGALVRGRVGVGGVKSGRVTALAVTGPSCARCDVPGAFREGEVALLASLEECGCARRAPFSRRPKCRRRAAGGPGKGWAFNGSDWASNHDAARTARLLAGREPRSAWEPRVGWGAGPTTQALASLLESGEGKFFTRRLPLKPPLTPSLSLPLPLKLSRGLAGPGQGRHGTLPSPACGVSRGRVCVSGATRRESSKGDAPKIMRNMITPRAQRSTSELCPERSNTSGAAKPGVPHGEYATRERAGEASCAFDKPKSVLGAATTESRQSTLVRARVAESVEREGQGTR